jgi:ABC-2 type transport system permease protein
MRNQIRAELRKLTTTRTTLGLLAGVVALVAVAAIGTVHDTSVAELSGPLHSRVFLNVLPFVLPVFVLALGIRAFAEEFHHGSIVPTFLATPGRRRVLMAKLAAIAVATTVLVLAAYATAVGLGLALAVGKGATISMAAAPLAASVGRLLAVSLLWGAIGVGVGSTVKHQVAAVAGALVWLFVGEQLVGGLAAGVARYLPSHASLGAFGTDPGLLAPVAGGLVLAAWAAVALVAGDTAMQRRDIA